MSKPYINTDQQVRLLADTKGLIIPDENYAKQILTDIGYFSLIGGYKSVFTNPMTRRYEVPTTFRERDDYSGLLRANCPDFESH